MAASARFSIDPTELTGKRVLVTGGTQGVGAAIVSRLVAAGARVATTARSEAPHRDAFDLFVRADVGTPEGAHEVARAVLEQYGGLDIRVHNVGGSSAPGGGFAALTDEEWQREIDLNLMAAVRLDRALLPAMLQ
jgi:NAD(P)-dependent dehydrogenase (short-subunit alcohol dehydrogenase family)